MKPHCHFARGYTKGRLCTTPLLSMCYSLFHVLLFNAGDLVAVYLG